MNRRNPSKAEVPRTEKAADKVNATGRTPHGIIQTHRGAGPEILWYRHSSLSGPRNVLAPTVGTPLDESLAASAQTLLGAPFPQDSGEYQFALRIGLDRSLTRPADLALPSNGLLVRFLDAQAKRFGQRP